MEVPLVCVFRLRESEIPVLSLEWVSMCVLWLDGMKAVPSLSLLCDSTCLYLQRLVEMRREENERTKTERDKREKRRQEKELLRLNSQ